MVLMGLMLCIALNMELGEQGDVKKVKTDILPSWFETIHPATILQKLQQPISRFSMQL